VAVGRRGRNAGEQAGRPANARAREGPRVAGGGYCGAWTRGGAEDGGAHWRASADGDGGRCGAARCCAPGECEGGGGRGASGGPIGAHSRQLARPAGPRRAGCVRVAVGPSMMVNACSAP
jgi:hypothetical protein